MKMNIIENKNIHVFVKNSRFPRVRKEKDDVAANQCGALRK